MKRAWSVFALFFLLQTGFWWHSLDHPPVMEIVPSVPSELTIKAITFGDSQFFFRLLGLNLQNFGDSFGRYTPLKDYDFSKLGRWFHLLDSLDNTSNYIPALAGFYFSNTQNSEDSIHVITYLRDHARGRIEQKWWWQAQAVYLAQHKLKDHDLALELALPLVSARNVPIWVNQLAAFIYEQKGEYAAALDIMTQIQKNIKNIPPGELSFMEYFFKERLAAMDHTLKPSESEGALP